MFCGGFRGGGEARMGGFAAEFRGFRVVRGCGAAIQRTADAAGVIERKNFLKIFKKGVKTRKLGCGRSSGRWRRDTLYRVCEVIFRSGFSPLAALLEVRLVQTSQLQAPA